MSVTVLFFFKIFLFLISSLLFSLKNSDLHSILSTFWVYELTIYSDCWILGHQHVSVLSAGPVLCQDRGGDRESTECVWMFSSFLVYFRNLDCYWNDLCSLEHWVGSCKNVQCLLRISQRFVSHSMN
jgi:hypothetical protein